MVACLIAYYLLGSMRISPKAKASKPARIHMGILLAISSVMVGVTYFIDRWTMVYGQNSPTDGAMYTDVHAIIPARTIFGGYRFDCGGIVVFAPLGGLVSTGSRDCSDRSIGFGNRGGIPVHYPAVPGTS